MSAVEVLSWEAVRAAEPGMSDFRVHRANFGGRVHAYIINAKFGPVTYRLVNFTTNAPLSNELRDACINLARCSS
jgi:hypothetical protein